jgi:hypothetical protein
MKSRVIFLLTTGSVFLGGCNALLKSVYGVKEPKMLTETQVIKLSNNMGIPQHESYILDKKFFSFIKESDSVKNIDSRKCSPMISKYQQPLQAYYFDESGKLLSFHNNCNAPGFPNLKWNIKHQFDKFVPTTTIPVTDSVVTLIKMLPFIQPLHKGNSIKKGEYTVLVFWCGFMKKQSNELIKIVRENLKLDVKKTSTLCFVNVDNCFVER